MDSLENKENVDSVTDDIFDKYIEYDPNTSDEKDHNYTLDNKGPLAVKAKKEQFDMISKLMNGNTILD